MKKNSTKDYNSLEELKRLHKSIKRTFNKLPNQLSFILLLIIFLTFLFTFQVLLFILGMIYLYDNALKYIKQVHEDNLEEERLYQEFLFTKKYEYENKS